MNSEHLVLTQLPLLLPEVLHCAWDEGWREKLAMLAFICQDALISGYLSIGGTSSVGPPDLWGGGYSTWQT